MLRIVTIKQRLCLLQEPGNNSRLMWRVISLWHVLLVHQQGEVLCLDLKGLFYKLASMFGIQVVFSSGLKRNVW